MSAAPTDPGVDGWVLPQQLLTNPAGQPVITPVQAEALVRAAWDQRNAGAAVGSPEAIQALESGPAAQFENLGAYDDGGTISAVGVYVPRQVAYPAFFLAMVRTTIDAEPDRRHGLVFTRGAPTRPWLLTVDSVLSSTGPDLSATTSATDGYFSPAPIPNADHWMLAGSNSQAYGVKLNDEAELACYAIDSTSTTTRSWFSPRRVVDPLTGRVHVYTTLRTTKLEQGCAIIPFAAATAEPEFLGTMQRTVAITGWTQPPPWLWIGVAGALLVLLTGALLSAVRAPLLPAGADEVKPASTPGRVRPFTAFERDNVRAALLLLAIEMAVVIEVVRWVAAAHLGVAVVIMGVVLAWILLLATPWPRRIRAQSILVIPAPPQKVWAVLTDELDRRIWSPVMESVERVSGSGEQGTVYRQLQRSAGGGFLEATKVVTVYEPERCYELRYPYLWRPQTEHYTLQPDPAGTLLAYEHDSSIGPLSAVCGGILMRAGFKAKLQATTAACLQRIRARVTDEPPPVQLAEPDGEPARRPAGRSRRNALLIGAGVMLVTALLSLGGYALLFGAVFGSLVMAVLVIHELGHYAEARRQGVPVRLPFFIPFVGAAVTMRRMPGDAGTHARIAMAGPLAGTLAVAVACVAAGLTNAQGLILFAQIGGLLNLVNLLPMSILDGGTILAPLSRWISVVGVLVAIGLIASLVASNQFSVLVLVIAGLAVLTMVNRFRQHRTTYYRSVGRKVPLLIGSVWLLTLLYLFFVTGVTGIELIVS